jgi:hypothetical protein
VYPGQETYSPHAGVEVLPLARARERIVTHPTPIYAKADGSRRRAAKRPPARRP